MVQSKVDPSQPVAGVPPSKAEFRSQRQIVQDELNSRLALAINVTRDYGAVGDGVTDNSPALLQMRSELKAQQDASAVPIHFELFFEPGYYKYSDAYWMWSLRSFEINAYGCEFENIATSQTGNPFVNGGFFSSGDPPDFSLNVPNYDIETVASASTVIVTKTPADAGDFLAGDQIFVYGFDQQFGGFPPNARYFEWPVVVTDGNPTTGEIEINPPLINNYDDQWVQEDPQNIVGPPKILNLTRSNWVFPAYCAVKGVNIVDNATFTVTIAGLSGRYVIYEDVSAMRINPSQADYTFINRCTMRGGPPGLGIGSEVDKLVNRVTFKDCIFFSSIDNATGCKHLIVDNCEVYSTEFRTAISVSPRKLTVKDSAIYTGPDSVASVGSNGWAVDSFEMTNNRMDNRNSAAVTLAPFAVPSVREFLIDEVGTSDEIRLLRNSPNFDLWRGLDMGHYVWNNTTGLGGRIENMTADATHLILSGTWATPTQGETWQFYELAEFIDGGGNTLHGIVPFDGLRLFKRPFQSVPLKTIVIDLDESGLPQTVAQPVSGFIRDIRCQVLTAITAGLLQCDVVGSGGVGTDPIRFDLTQVGFRSARNDTPVGSDVFTAAAFDRWTPQINVDKTGISGVPKFQMEIELVGPR